MKSFSADDNIKLDREIENDLVENFQRAFPKIGNHRRRRVRSKSYSLSDNKEKNFLQAETEEVFQRRPRSNSEPSTGDVFRKQQRRAPVRFPTPFSQKELEELSNVIAGKPEKMETIDLDFIGLPAHACKTNKLGDLVEVAEDSCDDYEDLRSSHFERALEEGRLHLKSDRIWRYKRHRKVTSNRPEAVDEWLRNSCNNNELISNAF